ncbi:adenosylcobinamide-phosphate synthase CbiB [Haloarculaceae archaeon H-GB1-1]|nr:adenosylcobinamide-phosphate synthase CbiB [Haloarculaceae archaeon H-GB1-1]
MTVATLAVGLSLALDLLVGELPEAVHPVAYFGRFVGRLDREWTNPRLVGTAAALVLPLLAAGVLAAPVWALARREPLAGAALAGVVLFASTSLRLLVSIVREVVAASETDLDGAREGLLALAGRDAASLSAGQVRSAAVESLAENLADGLVAALGAFALGAVVGAQWSPAAALALAAAAAAWTKAVNTMDSMLGYRSKPVGWAPAKLDDVVMWLPARASALALAVVALDPASLRRAKAWNPDVPSPNSGWPMGVAAAALDVRLEKPGVYDLNSSASLPSVADAERGVRLVAAAGLLSYVVAGVVAWS